MIAKKKPPSASSGRSPAGEPQSGPWQAPSWTLEERLQCIEAMGQRIHTYVQFMCQVGSLNGTSAEAKARAVEVFSEQLEVLERQLGRILEDLQLG